MLFSVWLFLQEFWHDFKTQKTRAFLTTFAVAWGTFSVVLLLAFGEGLQNQMLRGSLNNGDKIIRVFGSNTSMEYKGLPKGRRIRLKPEDADLLKKSIPQIDLASPCYGGRYPAEYNGVTTRSGYTVGVNPEFSEMRRMYPVAGGRFISGRDMQQERRVAFMGSNIAERLFGDEEPVGKSFDMGGSSFTVVGVMPEKYQNSMSNGPDDRRIVIPHTTYKAIWPRRRVWYIAVRPRYEQQHLYIQQRITEVLSKKYEFSPDDDRAISYWDSIEDEQTTRKIFAGIKIFMGTVGGMTLLIAGVGIANIMYVVVRERTQEIGIKRAIGAKRRNIVAQFVFEAFLITGIGGAVGIGLSLGVIYAVTALSGGENFALETMGTPVFSAEVAAVTIGILMFIGLFAGIYPARRAARIEPVEALRYE